MTTYTATPFYYSRTNSEGFKPSVSCDMSKKLQSWQGEHMYRTSTYNQSIHNVRKYILIK